MVIGGAALLGWAVNVPGLREGFLPSDNSVKVTTAAGLLGVGLGLLVARMRPRLSARLGGGVALLGLGSLAGYGVSVLSGGRLAAWWDVYAVTGHPMRMSVNTATALAALGAAMVVISRPRLVRAGQWLAVVSGMLGMAALLASVFPLTLFAPFSDQLEMSLPTSIGVMAGSLGLFLVYPRLGLAGQVTSRRWGGRMFRGLFPLIALGWPMLGLILVRLEQRDLLELSAALALFSAATIATFGAALWFAARALNGADALRERSEAALRQMNESLEQRVRERTRELAASDRHFAALAEAVPAMIWVAESPMACTYVNRVYSEFVGRATGSLMGMGWMESVHAEDATALTEEIRRAGSEKREFSARIRMKRSDGEYRWVHFRAVPRLTPEGFLSGFIGACVDVTEWELAQVKLHGALRQGEAALEREKTLRRELDHRVRNNLAGLIGLMSVYQRDGRSVERVAEEVKDKIRAMKEVHDIIVRAGGRSVSLAELVGTLLGAMCAGEAMAKISLSGPEVAVGAQPASALTMILQELATNSFKHGALGAAGGEVSVRWERETEGNSVLLRMTWKETGGGGEDAAARTAADGRAGGMGLKLIEGFARADLRGDCEFVRGGGSWTCVLHARLDDMGGCEKTEKHTWLQTAA